MKLRIGHLDYAVRLFRDDDAGKAINYGECSSRSQEIRLHPDNTPERQLDTLIHEITHAAWEAYRMPEKATEEHVVSFVGSALAGVIRNNPHLLPVLMALRDGGSFVDEAADA